MTAIELVMRRAGLSAEDAAFYVAMAEARVRQYLSLDVDADLSPYLFGIVDIAILYYQKDTSAQNAAVAFGYKTESFSEGNVSESHGVMTGAELQSSYDTAISDILAGLEGDARKVFFL